MKKFLLALFSNPAVRKAAIALFVAVMGYIFQALVGGPLPAPTP
mgnify:CR=1